MQLTHTGQNQFVRFLVTRNLQGGIFLRQALQAGGNLVHIALVLRLQGKRNNRLQGFRTGKHNRFGGIAQGIAGHRAFQLGHCDDITGGSAFDGFLLFPFQAEQLANTLGCILAGIVHIRVALHGSGIDPEQRQLAGEGVTDGLENPRRKRSVVFAGTFLFRIAARNLAHNRFTHRRRRHVLRHDVQQHVQANHCRRASAQNRRNDAVGHALFQAFEDFRIGQFFRLQIFFHERVVRLGNGFHQLHTQRLGLVLQIGGDIAFRRLAAVVGIGLHGDQVDHALQAAFRADRQSGGNNPRAARQGRCQILDGRLEIGAFPIHLVDEDHAGNLILTAPLPDLDRLRLDATHCRRYQQGAVHHADGVTGIMQEVGVARSIDNVERGSLPVEMMDAGADRQMTLDLFRLEIHGGRAIFHLAQAVDGAVHEQQRFRQRGFSRAAMPNNANIPQFFPSTLAHLFSFP